MEFNGVYVSAARKRTCPRMRNTAQRLVRPLSHLRNAHSSAGGSQDPFIFCREQVRKYDYNSHLLSYFYPRRTQDAYFALKAFNVRPFLSIKAGLEVCELRSTAFGDSD